MRRCRLRAPLRRLSKELSPRAPAVLRQRSTARPQPSQILLLYPVDLSSFASRGNQLRPFWEIRAVEIRVVAVKQLVVCTRRWRAADRRRVAAEASVAVFPSRNIVIFEEEHLLIEAWFNVWFAMTCAAGAVRNRRVRLCNIKLCDIDVTG